ncbi:neuropeptide Y receptor type 1-like [Orbicella faveolata]|uniref:neuropeptide Y receptor type 1-like n=1 Tax=Orbicella faveolata TaxID=48498 RepID=UPI0009E53F57|nr:neuropeptide Y receptor type 1-like [Orbicella faveolata]
MKGEINNILFKVHWQVHLVISLRILPFSNTVMFANNSSTNPLIPDEYSLSVQNGTCLLPIDRMANMICFATIYSLLLIASLVGNSLLIFASLKSKMTMNLLIANIAASDVLFSIVHFPREILDQVKGSTAFLVHGRIGHVLCKICAFTADATIAVSTLSLILVAADRLIAVVFPAKYIQITVKKRRLLILYTWIVAMAIHSPYFYTFRLDAINGETLCITNWEPAFNHESTHTRYYTALLFVVLIVPLVTVCILQTITLLRLKDDKMQPFLSSLANQRRKKRTKMLLKMSVVIALAFALCWLPFIALQFLLLYFPSSIPNCSFGFTIFNQFAILFALCHCMVNPCICFTFLGRIRIVLKSINAISRKKSSTFIETRL